MIVKGLQKLTLLDYPEKIACTVFLGGCNMRCPFCHNGGIVLGGGTDGISTDELFAFLASRRTRLGGVCISGGEPTLHGDLPLIIERIKELGFSVKLDTNGTNPKMLSALISGGLIDYVAMDIKNSPEKYAITAGIDGQGTRSEELLSAVKESARLLMCGDIPFEFRTTLMKELHSAEDIASIGLWLRGEEKYYLQTYRDEGDLLVGGFTPYTKEESERILSILREYIPKAQLR